MIKIPNITVKHNWRKAKSRTGLYTIHICIHFVGESRRYYPVKLPKKVSSEQWSGSENQWVTSAHPFYFEINCKIAETIHKLNELIKRHYNQDKPVTFYAIERELMYRGDRNMFNDYFVTGVP